MVPSEKRIVLIPIDFTEITLSALDQAIKLARVIGAEITLINVMKS